MRKVLLMLAPVYLVGCMFPSPLPVSEPEESIAVSVDGKGKRVVNPLRPGVVGVGLVTPSDLNDVIVNLHVYRDHYSSAHNKLFQDMNRATNGAVAGGVVGVVSGLAGWLPGAIGGAGLASSSSIYGQRYAHTVQAVNYRKASRAMGCMISAIAPLSSQETVSPETVIRASQKIEEVRDKLLMVQASVTLAEVDMSQLQRAMTEVADSNRSAGSWRVNLQELYRDESQIQHIQEVESIANKADEDAVIAAMEVCVKSF